MDIEFSCDVNIDFVRGMIPHHQGAVDMCRVLDQFVRPDAFLSSLCQEIIFNQEDEIDYMTSWLQSHDLGAGRRCSSIP